jgi:hypothetical protein
MRRTHTETSTAGRTSWRRLLIAFVPTLGAATAIVYGVAAGAVAASFTSGSPFTVTLRHLDASGFGMNLDVSQGQAAVLTRWADAKVTGLCQSSTVNLPLLGPVTMVLQADSVHATDLVIDAYTASGQLNLQKMLIGPTNGATGYQAGQVALDNITIQAGSAAAGTFSLSGVHLSMRSGTSPCSLQ